MFKRAALSLSVSLMMLTSQEAFSALYVEQYSPELEYASGNGSTVKDSDSDLVIYNSKTEGGAVSGVKAPPKQFVYSTPAKGPVSASAPIPTAKAANSGTKLADDVAAAVANASKSPAPLVAQKQAVASASPFLTNSSVATPAAQKTEGSFLIKEPSSKTLTATPSAVANATPIAPISKPAPIAIPKKTAHFGTDENFAKQYMKVMSEQTPAWTVIWRSGSDFQITVPYSLQYKDPVDLAGQLDSLYKLNSKAYRENRTVVVLGPSK
ncbi:TPA: hypothetical protein ACSCYS_003684 [Aeromonas veronii]